MRINSINTNTNFKHKIMIDIGASNPKGTCKVLVKSDDGRDIYKSSGFLNSTPDGFKRTPNAEGQLDGGQAEFISKLDDVIYNTHQHILKETALGNIKLAKDINGSDAKDRKLSGVAVFVPGTTFTMCKDDRIAFIPNLKNDKGESLVNIDFKEYEREIKENGRRAKGLDASDDFELIVTKDLGGAGIGLSKVLAKRDELKIGDYVMGVMTGGGFGSVDIKVKGTQENPLVEFETSESSSYLTGNTLVHDKIADTVSNLLKSQNPQKSFEILKKEVGLDEFFPVLEKLGRQGVSVKSHLKCYINALDLPIDNKEKNDLITLAQKVGDARLVSIDKMFISKKDTALCEEVSANRFFKEVESTSDDKRVFSLNRDLVSEEQIKKARVITVEDYANSVSLISINKINDCINKVYLVGPFAQGLNKDIKNSAQDYGAPDLPTLIMQKIKKNIDENHVNLPSTQRLMELYNFEVICDPEINFSDNTFAGDVLLNKEMEFVPNRGSWFSIPLETLKNQH